MRPLINTMIRVGWMLCVSAGLAVFFKLGVNYLGYWPEIDYLEAWTMMFLLGVVRFMWDFEKLI